MEILRLRLRLNLQQLADITSSKDFMDAGEFVGLVGWEIRAKYAVLRAPPPQKLARGAWGWGTLFAAPAHIHLRRHNFPPNYNVLRLLSKSD